MLDLRHQLYREATRPLHKDVLKEPAGSCSSWLPLKRPEHLDDTRDESKRLYDALKANASRAPACDLEEDLRLLWEEPTKRADKRFLDDGFH